MLPIKIDSRELETLYYNTISNIGEEKCIAITSSNRGEGVSVSAYALARRAAASGHKTLLMDMNIDNSHLSDWLASEKHQWQPSDLKKVNPIEELGNTGLSILSAPDHKSALWSFREKNHLGEMFVGLREKYDCIIVDVPSVLENNGEHNIPAETICSMCDKTLLMVLSAKTPEGDITQAISILKKSGAQMRGTVLNDLYEPNIKDEICREIDRVKRFIPKLSQKMKCFIRNSAFLSQDI